MLRQKKLSLQNSTVKQSLAIFLNQNLASEYHTQQLKNCNSFKPHAKVFRDNQNRQCLKQIDISHNSNIQVINQNVSAPNNKLLLNFGNKLAVNKTKQQDPIFDKILQLIRNEELNIPSSNPIKSKKVLVLKERPSTSLSRQKRKITEQPEACQGHVVFQLNKKEQEDTQNDPHKVSTSRALMNFSKVYRNSSGQRFKVRRGKTPYRNSVHLQAQRIVLHEKQKKERYSFVRSMQKSVLTVKTARQKQILQKKNRYADQQQFQLAGWEYFE